MKIAVVTGASSGMGRETAIQLADRFGGKLDELWLVARRKERLEELEGHLPVPLRLFPMDITDPLSLEQLRLALEEMLPEVVFLVNAAGFGKIGRIGAGPLADETGMIQLNCQALCAVTHLVLPYMMREGRILMYASSAAFLPQPKFAIYAATKSFVLSYSRALHAELKPRGICVTAICPGPVDTEFFEIAESGGRKIPLYKRLAMAAPKKVVKKAIRDSLMGKTQSIYGLWMKLFFLLSKAAPHGWLLKGWEVLDSLSGTDQTLPAQTPREFDTKGF